MEFDDYVRQANGLYSALLESGGQDRVALEQATKAAYHALDKLPPASKAKMPPHWQREIDNLLDLYRQLTADSQVWHLEDRRGWLDEVLELVRSVGR
ncbi:MAG: hypothetical protein ACRYFX_19765 [Janthinobacterium lividum]